MAVDCSCVSGCVPEVGFVRVEVALVHELSLLNLSNKEPQCNHNEKALPNAL